MYKKAVIIFLTGTLFCGLAFTKEVVISPGSTEKKLKSSNPSQVLDSIKILAKTGTKRAAEAIADLLQTGPRNDITNAALSALGAIGHKISISVLIDYLGHRRADARIVAIFALSTYTTSSWVTKALEDCLRDSDKQVRATAALTLGKMGSQQSIPVLFTAFDREVGEAAISIGKLGTPLDAEKLAQYLGEADVNVLLNGFYEFMTRSDFPQEAKAKILDQLLELAGPDVRRFAVKYKASFPEGTKEGKNKLFKQVSRMIRMIPEE